MLGSGLNQTLMAMFSMIDYNYFKDLFYKTVNNAIVAMFAILIVLILLMAFFAWLELRCYRRDVYISLCNSFRQLGCKTNEPRK